MTNTQELFDEWHDNTYGVKPSFNRNHEGSSHWDGDKQDRWEAWRDCQAHNDAVIAELVEALESMIRENISNREYAPQDILFETTQEHKAKKLIEKHKEGIA